jgi:thiol:disulfide interchange protein
MKKPFLGFIVLVVALAASFKQIEKHASWDFAFSKKEVKVGETVDVILSAKIDNGWYMYASDFAAEGPMPTSVKWVKNDSYELVGGLKSISPKKKYDEIWEGEVAYFTGSGELRQTVKILKENPDIDGKVTYQTCVNGEGGKCVPGNDILKLPALKVSAGTATAALTSADSLKKAQEALAALAKAKRDSLRKLQQTSSLKDSIKAGLDTLSQNPLVNLSSDSLSTLAANDSTGVSSLFSGGANSDISNIPLWQLIFFAFLAGLAAVLTPCVYPMIPMTVAFFTRRASSRQDGLRKAFIYGLSIVVIFTVIGTLLAYLFGASFANFISTHWLPNVLFFAVFLFFGISFLGYFEIVLPSSIVNSMDEKADQGTYMGIFFMAFTLVLVSFSCTAPIVGAAALLSSQGQIIKPVLAMISFSSAFALPFVLFAIFPQWLQSMPKSGGWMNTVKVVLGFLEIALALKFLSIPDQTYHWGILPRPIYLALWILIALAIAFNILGILRLSHDSKLEKISPSRWIIAILFFGIAGYLGTGLFGKNDLRTISGLLPPPQAPKTANTKTITLAPDGSKPKYADLFHLPHGLAGFFDFKEATAYAQKVNKPVLIDFTGHGCVNCREMEEKVWSDTSIMRRIKNDYVLVALYVDDKTELPKAEWYTSKYDDSQKTSIGDQNLDFQIVKFNANAQPFYCLVKPDGSLIIKPTAYDLNIKKFAAYLDEGKQKFYQTK